MADFPGPRAHTRPQPGQEIARPQGKQSRFVDDHQVVARAMARRPVGAQRVETPGRTFNHAGIWRSPDSDVKIRRFRNLANLPP